MPSLIERQEDAIERLLRVPPQTARGSGHLQRRMRRKIRKDYERDAARLGYPPDQIDAQWQDVKDMAELRRVAEDADEPMPLARRERPTQKCGPFHI